MKILLIIILVIRVNSDLLDGEKFYLDAIKNVILPQLETITNKILYIRAGTLVTNAAYDATTPYLEHGHGFAADIPKRPKIERTQRNKNIAIAYAIFRMFSKITPSRMKILETFFQKLDLSSTDNSLDLDTSIGIGNYAALKVYEARMNDGMNQLGDMNGKTFNRIPFEDYTNFVPNNTAYELKFPGLWQPNIHYKNGVATVQQYAFPQLRLVKPYFLQSVNKIPSNIPLNSDPLNFIEYKNQVDEVLKETSELDDIKKLTIEHFDANFEGFSMPALHMIERHSLAHDDLVIFMFLSYAIKFDASIYIWNEKMKYLTVRPFSAIKYLYKDSTIPTARGGIGVGIVRNVSVMEWRPYLESSGANGEYPALRSCLCSAIFNFYKKFFLTNEFNFSIVKPKGSSVVEQNITPSQDITLGPYNTFDEYINDCAISRVWAGGHFKAAVEEGKRLCKPIGDETFQIAKNHLHLKISDN